jgi:hypothetical protein
VCSFKVGRYFFVLPEKFWGSILLLLCLLVCPSSYFLILLSEIDAVDTCNKCSLRQGLVDQGLSRSFWKVEGHSEHVNEFFIYGVHISWEIYHNWTHALLWTKFLKVSFERPKSLLFEKKNLISPVSTGI